MNRHNSSAPNLDPKTVSSFGDEWSRYDQSELDQGEHTKIFDDYFDIFPWHVLPENATGVDLGCGSGRWAKLVAPRVHQLNCVDASPEALAVARKNLGTAENVTFHNASLDQAPLAPESQDFGYSLGVLHHIPDTQAALISCVKLLKPEAPLLLYLYYRFDNRPAWFRLIWQVSNLARTIICRMPRTLKFLTTDLIALFAYLPLARMARLLEKAGIGPSRLPLSFYRDKSFYTMRTDSRDRFGTPLEQRFTRSEITEMMTSAGLGRITFSDREPFWCVVGTKNPIETPTAPARHN